MSMWPEYQAAVEACSFVRSREVAGDDDNFSSVSSSPARKSGTKTTG